MDEQTRRYFEEHWGTHISGVVASSKVSQAERFFAPILDSLRSHPLTILDVGCGDGVHWRYLRSLDNPQLKYTGVDISQTVITHLRQQTTTPEDRFVQMDAVALTEPDDTYDVVFAFGVIAYTRDPQRSFAEMCRVCKPGGWVGAWIFPKVSGVVGLAFELTRKLCQIVGPFGTLFIANLIVPWLGILPTQSKASLKNSTWRQCRELVLVNIAPKQLAFFRHDEVAAWFAANNIDIVYEDPANSITIWGQKR
ncbi:class I SAM-dependent DNA methyltransferase [Chloroflexota bacterium]